MIKKYLYDCYIFCYKIVSFLVYISKQKQKQKIKQKQKQKS